MTTPREALMRALSADDAIDLAAIVRRRRPRHLAVLKRIIADDGVDPVVRARAVSAIGAWGDAEAAPSIVAVIDELDDDGRASAVQALGRLDASIGVDILLRASHDPSPHLRKIAVAALARSDHDLALSRVREMASDDAVPWVRERASRALDRR